jgi:hypothetical protein
MQSQMQSKTLSVNWSPSRRTTFAPVKPPRGGTKARRGDQAHPRQPGIEGLAGIEGLGPAWGFSCSGACGTLVLVDS